MIRSTTAFIPTQGSARSGLRWGASILDWRPRGAGAVMPRSARARWMGLGGGSVNWIDLVGRDRAKPS